jgi:hypothetical protein
MMNCEKAGVVMHITVPPVHHSSFIIHHFPLISGLWL